MVTKFFCTFCTKTIPTVKISKLEFFTKRKYHRNMPRGILDLQF